MSQLCEGIIACDRATQVSTSRFLESFSSFLTPQPSKYQELADAARHYRPGSEFMSFLQNLPGRSISSSSLLRGEHGSGGISLNTTTGTTDDDNAASTSTGGRSSTTSTQSSTARFRRNALNEVEHYDLIVETQQHRKPKISMGRLFDPSNSTSTEYTEPTRSHKLVRTRQVIKCVQCDRLSSNSVVCGPNAKPFAESARRVSIFGVPLKSHLELQKRKVPQILEKCIDEIQRKGMRTKGLYRTCGLKSKVEQICQTFEQSDGSTDIKLDDNNITAMNVASVIKLYLRKLPEPLLSFELYSEFLHFDTEAEPQQIITRLQDLIATKLPEQNYETLKFLMIHLKRVTWFQKDNLMPAANVAAVITPSLIWAPIPQTPGFSTPASATSGYASSCGSFVNDAHQQSKVIELLIKNAFEIFEIDSKADWKNYFERYPNVKEPEQMDDNNVEEIVTNDEPAIDEDDCLEEDDYDDELDQVCSSSNISQQPPTPDLLRNTNNNNRKNIQNSADDLVTVESEQGYNRKYIPAVRTVSAGYHPSTITNFKQQRSTTESSSGDDGNSSNISGCGNEGFSKQRSFTTSILVSPQNNRKIFLPQQRSIEEQPTTKGYSKNIEVPENCSQTCIQSGEVTIDIKKVENFFAQNRLILSPSTDVSYV
uniref:Rho-GAP domain-containing protein n=1 Tax=Panagrolaimus sp. PS1159 TaxID=55785 RepID=A0AC35FYD9_9BILA